MNTSICAPNIDTSDHYTCFDHSELMAIANSFNKYIKKCNKKKCNSLKINYIDLSLSKHKLWKEIYKRLNKICKYEYCWIDMKFIDSIDNNDLKNKIKFFTFKPKMTLKKYSWLSTNDIDYVLKQYEKIDKNFKFLGALPCDFYKVIPRKQLKTIINNILNYKRSGFVFNLDKNSQNGSHWVSFFIDNSNHTLEYFDSVGNPPNKCIKYFISKLRNILKDYKYLENKKIHQLKNSECGVYSIYYILSRLSGKDFYNITNKIIRDDEMNRFRYYIFRPRK
jgi:hypothetical protein